ncbi:uncharacterized protein LOC130444290 [Diorhabda sublineata]|uniref:uncharacterized protein LOC130444290 n=1 Tax=Diorhabda sublineata TaxID=1163346 RepID=UPI0024E179D7|nr:uncharacterized protein LOC130444290 [Diorhabda sublineata]
MAANRFIYFVIIFSVKVNAQYQQTPSYNYNDLQQQMLQNWRMQQALLQQQVMNQQYPYYGQQQVYYPVNNQPIYYPYPYQYGVYQPQPQRNIPETTKNKTEEKSTTPDPYAGVETEYIDVQPEAFRKIIQTLRVQPTIISYETRVKTKTPKYSYVVKTENNQSNDTNIPVSVNKYESNSKVYTFNKTFVLHPGDNKDKVVNFNFVNGVQVTDSPVVENIETLNETTTLPVKNSRRFIDVPTGCKDGYRYSATGGCFSPFQLSINGTESTTTETY